ncbi:MAG TPA: ParB/RepB/Spo0J family partition protein [bacterium]|nr:ParB/RepB/Spo0J family partition protein [bacterium]
MATKRLGRGISALIPEERDPEPGTIALIEVDKIRPNPTQPRKEFDRERMRELEQSIAQKGVVQPVTVRKLDNEFELIVGERRWRASESIGLTQIPAYVLEVQSDAEMMEFALIENVQRQDLNPIELAHAYNALVEQHGLSQEEVAQQVGKNRSTITNFIRLLDLPSYIQQSVKEARISAGHARALLAVNDEEVQRTIWEKILEAGLSVREVEEVIREFNLNDPEEKSDEKEPSSPGRPSTKSPHIRDIEDRLQHQLGTKVNIKTKKDGGVIQVQFYSDEELDRLLDLFEVLAVE